jgi:hypothetical protein
MFRLVRRYNGMAIEFSSAVRKLEELEKEASSDYGQSSRVQLLSFPLNFGLLSGRNFGRLVPIRTGMVP